MTTMAKRSVSNAAQDERRSIAKEIEWIRDEACNVHAVLHCALRALEQSTDIEKSDDGMRGLATAFEARDRLDRLHNALDELTTRSSRATEAALA